MSGFATRWVDGLPLTAALAHQDRASRLAAFAQLVDVTGYLHRRGLLHLDLKPENALFGTHGLCLLDLGSARPVDSGPGEAGGTLGFAAPEVLAGQAASVAADVFSLGAILYALLTDAAVFSGVEPADLRRAALAGEYVPVRARAPHTPPALAQLVAAMLDRRPSRRPPSTHAVAEALSSAGVPIDPEPGEPPLVGREQALERLTRALSEPKPLRITLVGPTGSGRTRLARAALRRSDAASGRTWHDLAQVSDPLRYLDGVACAAGIDVPARGSAAAWIRAVAAGIEAWDGPPGAVWLGRRGDHPPDRLRTLDALVPSLILGGFSVLEAAEAERPGALPVWVGPLAASESAAVARFHGLTSAGRIREVHDRTGGLPGALMRVLRQPRERIGGGLGEAAGSLALLSSVPPGVPADALAALALPNDDWERLVSRGLVRLGADGRAYVEPNDAPEPAVAQRRAAAQALLGVAVPSAPAWVALALARLGDLDSAAAAFDRLEPGGPHRRSILLELAERLSPTGSRAATRMLAEMREEDGDLAAAAALLEGLTDRSSDEERQLVRVLRRGGRTEQALHLARAQLARAPGPQLWLELAHILVSRGELADAEAACAAAEALAPSLADGDALALRVGIAARGLARGDPPAGLDRLLDRVEGVSAALDSATLSSAGRILTNTGQLDRGERMLARAAERADLEGDARRSAGIRLNRANALQSLGRGRDARGIYREALAIAEGTGDTSLRLRIRYSLADLELRAGRLPSAETQVRAFQAEAAGVSISEVRARVQELRGRLLLARDRPEEALQCLKAMDDAELSPSLRLSRDLALAGALLALGRAEEVLPTLADTPSSRVETVNAYRDALRGRAHLAIARRYLGAARAAVPAEPDALVRLESGSILLASAGEDIDPDSFGRRRADLDHAARLLRGSAAADAATLRDRLLEGPGANLEGIVELTEAMHDPQAFPGALARLVGEALGAYRVLIMVTIPGLGRQVTYTELSGSEAAGIGREVLRRVKRPDDHWLAHNAFADPHLRETSQTVRTFELKSLLAVAIPRGDKAVGALYVDDLHRTNRFTDDDVAILKRLARGVGRMLPLLATSRQDLLPEPRDVLGVLLSDRGTIRELDSAVEMMRDRPQLNLLVSGPTGAGKSVLARRVAREVLGKDDVEAVVLRRGDPQFLVTQLTGAQKGEYTGALTRDGAIQRCLKHDRVLFLDEVQNLDDTGQQILLPLLELPQRYFGGLTASSSPIGRPLHIILGTNADVSKGRWAAHFREDLWYRMSTVHVALPPLRDRGSEAVYRYLRGMLEAAKAPRPEAVFDTAALHRLTSWEWPGNLRQLQQVADRAASLHQGGDHRLGLDALQQLGVEAAAAAVEADAEGIDQAMVDAVWQALRRHQFVQSKAAQELKMSPSRLSKFLDRFDLREEVSRLRRAARDEPGG